MSFTFTRALLHKHMAPRLEKTKKQCIYINLQKRFRKNDVRFKRKGAGAVSVGFTDGEMLGTVQKIRFWDFVNQDLTRTVIHLVPGQN